MKEMKKNQYNKDFNDFKEKLEKQYKKDDELRDIIEKLIDRRHNGEHIDIMIIAKTTDDDDMAPINKEPEDAKVDKNIDFTNEIEECEDECCEEDADYMGCMLTDIDDLTQEIMQLKKLIMMQPVFFPEKGVSKKDIKKWMKRAVKDSLDEMFEIAEAPKTDPDVMEMLRGLDKKFTSLGEGLMAFTEAFDGRTKEIIGNQQRTETYFTEQIESISKRLSAIERKLPSSSSHSKSSSAK